MVVSILSRLIAVDARIDHGVGGEPGSITRISEPQAGRPLVVLIVVCKISNRQPRCKGISGHKVFQLADRWDDDCLNLKPDVLSVLIGVNDFWHSLGDGYDGTAQVYEADFRALLDRTKQSLPETKLIIGEPFAVTGGTAIDDRWSAFDDYRSIAKKIATDYGAVFLPYHDIFSEALKLAPASYWCPDGVHPSMAGSYLMSQAWIAGFQSM